MKKLNNRGVSLIEILIAVVIFVVCITPIINQLATGIRVGQRADDQQAATDYGKSLAESLKQVDMASVIDLERGLYDKTTLADMLQIDKDSMNVACSFYSVQADGSDGSVVPSGSYVIQDSISSPTTLETFDIGTGSAFNSVTAMYQAINAHNASSSAVQEALVREYYITGTATLDYREYDVAIKLDTRPYALSSLTKAGYSDPNAVNLGNLSSLDANTTAVITAISNYDSVASASFFNAALSAMENSSDEGLQNQAVQIKNGNRTFTNSAEKSIYISIDPLTGDTNGNNYKVTCRAIYESPDLTSNYGVAADDTVLDYTVYEQKFKNLPDVYLMYNQFLYASSYGDDIITIENNAENKEAKVYVIRTAETNDGVSSIVDISTGSSSNSLLPSSSYGRDVKNGSNYIYMTKFVLKNDKGTYPVKIYTNMDVTVNDGTTDVSNVSSSLANPNDRTCKMSVNVSAAEVGSIVLPLDEDERYSETGRVYDIQISLTNTKTDIVTTYESSKGDY